MLTVAVRRKRLKHTDASITITLFQSLSIHTDDHPVDKLTDDLLKLTLLYGLSAYDAAYLELSLRKGGCLATLDQQLQKAATEAGIVVFGS